MAATADAAAGSASAGNTPPLKKWQKRGYLRLEYISERSTRSILLAQRVAGVLAYALLFWELYAQFDDDSNSLLRNDVLENVNLAVGSTCFAVLASAGLWFASRVAATRRLGRPWAVRRKYPLILTSIEVSLQLLNLGIYIAMNIYSKKVDCGWFDITNDVLGLVQLTIWNFLFYLNISRPLILLPSGAWQRWMQRHRLLGRCVATAAAAPTCGSGCCGAGIAGSGKGTPAQGPSVASRAAASHVLPPQQQGVGDYRLDLEQQPSLERVSTPAGDQLDLRVARALHVAVFLLLWVPTEVLSVVAAVGSMGFLGGEILYVCPTIGSECLDPIPSNQVPSDVPWDQCTDWIWDCTISNVFAGLSLTVGVMHIIQMLVFLGLMTLVLVELRRLPYTPYRVMNVAARLQLRTRVFTSIFFVICLILLFYLNIDSCSAQLEVWLGLGPMHISMTALLVAEAFLYSPSAPKEAALKLHTSLQKFAWTEAGAPQDLRQRGFPDEPMFCFETGLKALYYCLHSYRHFRPESAVSSLQTAMKLYGCTHYEWLREPKHDMNCLLAWGPDALVITFRGTQSMKNVRADAQFWRSPHPPKRGVFVLGSQPLVHTGFLLSWLDQGLDRQVLTRVRQVLEGRLAHADMQPFDTTVVRCCSQEHEEKGAALAAAAAAAAAAEAAAAADADGGMTGYDDSEEEEEEGEYELAAAEQIGPAAAAACAAAGSGLQPGSSGVQQAAIGSSRIADAPNLQAGPSSSSTWNGAKSNGSSGCCRQSSGQQQQEQQQRAQRPFRILVTGHSLGGAVGSLCAMDLARLLPEWGFATVVSPASPVESASAPPASTSIATATMPPPVAQAVSRAAAGPSSGSTAAQQQEEQQEEQEGQQQAQAEAGLGPAAMHQRPVSLSCYTYGSPRPGNHAYAREFKAAVPDSWAIVNDQDLVAKSAKFLVLFKRAGHTVLINPQGDIIVNPSFLEHNVQRQFRASIKQHLLLSYNTSFAAILRGQHKGKGLSGGMEAMALLTANPAVRELLLKPLAFRKASLRRYVRSGAGKASGAAAAAATAAATAAGAGPDAQHSGVDLSGEALHAAEIEQGSQQQEEEGTLQTVAGVMAQAMQDTFAA